MSESNSAGKNSSSIQSVLILSFSTMIATIMILLNTVISSILSNEIYQDIYEKNLLKVKESAANAEDFFKNHKTYLKGFQTIFYEEKLIPREQFSKYCEIKLYQYPEFELFQVINSNGIVLQNIPAHPELIDLDISKQRFFSLFKTPMDAYWSDSFISSFSGDASVILAVPFGQNFLLGYLNLRKLSTILGIAKGVRSPKSFTGILDRNGVIIAHNIVDMVSERLNLRGMHSVDKGLSGAVGTYSDEYNYIKGICSVALIPEIGWLSILFQDEEDAFKTVDNIRIIIYIALVVALLIVVALIFIIQSGIVKPIKALAIEARKISNGNYDVQMTKSYTELNELITDFERMASTIEDRERELRTSEKKLSDILETMAESVMTYDANGAIVYANQYSSEILGVPILELIGRNIYSVPFKRIQLNGQKLENGVHPIHEVLKGGKNIFDFQYGIIRPDNTLRWVSVNAASLKDGSGKTIGAVLSARDITENRRMQEELRISEERFALAIEATNDALWDWNVRSGETYFSPKYYTMLGYEDGEFPASLESWKNLVHPLDLEDSLSILDEYLQSKRESYHMEFRMKTKNGGYRWILGRGMVVGRDLDDKPVRMIGTHMDITEQKRQNQELQNTKLLLETIIEQAPIPIIVASAPDSVFIMVNSAALLTLGIENFNEINKLSVFQRDRSWSMADENDRLLGINELPMAQTLRGKRIENLELKVIRSDNTQRWVVTSGTPIYNPSGEMIAGLVIFPDITDRKLAIEDLIHSEKKYRELYEGMRDGFVRINTDGIFVETNQSYLDMLGCKREELFGKTIYDVTPQKWHDMERNIYIQQMLDRGYSDLYEKEYARFDGTVFPVELQGYSIKDVNGKIIGYWGIVRDITERRKAEKELLETKENLAITLQSIGDAVIVTDTSGRITMMNTIAEELCGWKLKEAFGLDMQQVVYLINSVDGQLAENPVERVLQSGKIVGLANHTELISKSGKRYQIADSAAPIQSENGVLLGVVMVFRDVTEKYMRETELRESERRLSTLMANLPGVAYRCKNDRDWTMEFVSDGCKDIFGYPPEDIINNRRVVYGDMIHPEDRDMVWNTVQDALRERRPYRIDFRIIDSRGREKWLWEKGIGVFDEYDRLQALEGFIIDITDRRQNEIKLHTLYQDLESLNIDLTKEIKERIRTEEEIRRLNAELESRVNTRTEQLQIANKELESFSYSVSHDLRAPLRAIEGFTKILIESYINHIDPDGQKMLINIVENTSRMGQLIDDLLSFSRLGKHEINSFEMDMLQMVTKIIEEMKTLYPERKIDFTLHKLPSAMGDFSLIRQVWTNLISNAVKFTKNKKVAHIEIGSQTENNETVYYIRDNGAGFDMQYRNKLFTVFQRLHSNREFEGSGVGLAIVQRIISKHGGRIWAFSEVGHGATFYFTLPTK